MQSFNHVIDNINIGDSGDPDPVKVVGFIVNGTVEFDEMADTAVTGLHPVIF